MNAYKPKFHKKLMISPKNASYDLNFRGYSQGSTVITPQAEKVQSTRNSFAVDQKNKDTILQSNMNQVESTKNHYGYQNQFAQQQGQQQQLQQQQQSMLQMQQQQQMTIQQSQNQLNQQHQQQLVMMIQQQQQQQYGQQLQSLASSQKANQQQQQILQNQIQQSQYSNVLNLLMQQQTTQPQQQHQQIYQNLNHSQQYSSIQQSQGQNYSNQSFTTNRQNSNANYLYHQLNPPQSTKAVDSNRRQNNPFSGTYSTKNTSAPQQLLKDILSKINKEQVQQQLPYQQNQQALRSSHMMNNSQNNSNSNVVILNNNPQTANTQNIYSSNYVNTNPDLSNIYNPNNLSAMNPQPSSTKSNRIHSHYFPATTKNKSNRNPSLDKLNDSSFLRLKNVQSPKQRTIRTIMPGSNRDNSVGNNSSINRNGYIQREYSEGGVDTGNQYILPASLLQQKTKRSGNSITGGVNSIIANNNNNSYNNGSYSKIQPQLPQNQGRQNGTPYIKKDLTIKTGHSIETLKDILSPTNNNANAKTTTATKDSKKHLNSNTLPIQSYTTTHAQQINQQKRLLQKRDDQKNKSNFINSSFQYIMASETSSIENTNRFSYNVSNNTVANNQGQKLLKSKNNSMENQQFKNLSFTQPLVDQFKQAKENNNTQNSNNKILTVKQQQQKQQLQFIQKGLGQNSTKQNQSSIHTSEGNENKSESNYESQGQNLDTFDQHKIDLSTASQTPFRNGNSTNEKKTLDENNTRNTERDEKKEEPLDWEKVKVPITPLEVLAKYQKYLTPQEKAEILEYKRIYFIGHNANKALENGNNDDTKGDYQYNVNDHIAYRYEIKEFLGKGSFGQVLKVFDHKRKEYAALKVIRNKQKFHEQALIELNILHYIKEKDYDNQTNIVKIRDFVIFRNHVCLIFELLSINLYDLLRNNKFQGLSLELIRRFAIQLLNAISFLKENRIIHCDLKPENVLLKQPNKSGIKIADFGSSCFDDQVMYTYIQSRYYRSPEVILGIPYGTEIDMWSFGCIIAELFLGYPIFPGEDENEQMGYIMELLGAPDSEFLKKCSRKKYFFDQNDQPLQIPNSRGKIRMPNSKNWKTVIGCTDDNFIDFIKKCLVWEPSLRMTPRDALLHPWILDGLPEDIRVQHIKFLKDKSFETASEKEFHKQSCLQAQYNADAQSAAMALALQKIYKYNNKKRIIEKKSTTQGTVSEETRNSVMEEKKQTAEVSQMFNNFFIQPESTKNSNKNNQNTKNITININNTANFNDGNPLNETNKQNSLNQNNFSNNHNNIQNQNNFIILTNQNKTKLPNANSNSLTQKKKITAQVLQNQQNQQAFQNIQNSSSQQPTQKLTLQQQQVQLQIQLQKIAQQQKLQKLQ